MQKFKPFTVILCSMELHSQKFLFAHFHLMLIKK